MNVSGHRLRDQPHAEGSTTPRPRVEPRPGTRPQRLVERLTCDAFKRRCQQTLIMLGRKALRHHSA